MGDSGQGSPSPRLAEIWRMLPTYISRVWDCCLSAAGSQLRMSLVPGRIQSMPVIFACGQRPGQGLVGPSLPSILYKAPLWYWPWWKDPPPSSPVWLLTESLPFRQLDWGSQLLDGSDSKATSSSLLRCLDSQEAFPSITARQATSWAISPQDPRDFLMPPSSCLPLMGSHTASFCSSNAVGIRGFFPESY